MIMSVTKQPIPKEVPFWKADWGMPPRRYVGGDDPSLRLYSLRPGQDLGGPGAAR